MELKAGYSSAAHVKCCTNRAPAVVNTMSEFKEHFRWEHGRVPSVNPAHLAATWKFMGDTAEGISNTKTTGLGLVLARAGLSASDIDFLSRAEGGGFAFVVRSALLQSFVQRGV